MFATACGQQENSRQCFRKAQLVKYSTLNLTMQKKNKIKVILSDLENSKKTASGPIGPVLPKESKDGKSII